MSAEVKTFPQDEVTRQRGATMIRCAVVPSNKDSGSAHS